MVFFNFNEQWITVTVNCLGFICQSPTATSVVFFNWSLKIVVVNMKYSLGGVEFYSSVFYLLFYSLHQSGMNRI